MDSQYTQEIMESAQKVFQFMEPRVSKEQLQLIKEAFDFANEAHKEQKRKTGQPYIIHPIAVARIAAEELKLDANSVMAAFLHDVVEDTPFTKEDIEKHFGTDVANLVDIVTKKEKKQYIASKQVDNYKQLLESFDYDIRALMVKIADRLHNMRTLASMRPDKQMKIAGETDYFYAPLANRLGLFDVKTDLENLAFQYRCEEQYADIDAGLKRDVEENKKRLERFTNHITDILKANGIDATAEVYYRRPYSIWRRMNNANCDFKHVENRYYVRVTFTHCEGLENEKSICLKIYSLLTDVFKEKPQSFYNWIDAGKENSYQCIKVMLLSEEGVWEDVQICSQRMVEISKLGCMAELQGSNIHDWMTRFREVLKDIAKQANDISFLESVVSTTLYYDDIMVFTPEGKAIILPKGATAIDFAFEIHTDTGLHARFARINGKLSSIKTLLKAGDCVEIGTTDIPNAKPEWMDHTVTYKAKRTLRKFLADQLNTNIHRCPCCQPIPGGEIIGIKNLDGTITVHRRSCPDAIRLASHHGDRIVPADFHADATHQYPVTVHIMGLDRYHLLMDIVNFITEDLKLSIDSLTTTTKDDIVDCTVTFFVHSVQDLVAALEQLYTINGVELVRQVLED
ncbi:MAG: bifunctional (p)ppGpp synthetase/guanosine-3',5'-bis(diphosphate) 3'-pyrophosphohydrolase [Bacteroidales bacterium]|nr:bifunctional (p)ppGpp synthetase/guanosine-3',5'-bis(diphosphate) 3'-pyrophosphohydrolase [Candidatus Minthousia equi]